jgi:apolipoprotein N-acyltransferase
VTNTGITAYITANGEVKDATEGFQTDARTWSIDSGKRANTFYSNHGDLFVEANAIFSLMLFAGSFNRRRRERD